MWPSWAKAAAAKTTLLQHSGRAGQAHPRRGAPERSCFPPSQEKALSAFRRDNLGFVFQDFNLLDTFSIRDNIFSAAGAGGAAPTAKWKPPRPHLPRSWASAASSPIIPLRSQRRPETARGRRPRLITRPQLTLADEPTGALDSRATDSLLRLFGEINEDGQTILMVTHPVKAASHAGRCDVHQGRRGIPPALPRAEKRRGEG